MEGREAFHSDQWDLTTQQVLPYIDGFNHVARIAAKADVENNLVKSCVQNLVYYGVVTLIPIFQYSNVYAATPKLRELADDAKLQERCIAYASKFPRQPAYSRDIYRMYASMTHGSSMRDLCQRLNPQNLRINERKLVQFGLIEGLIRRVYKYPIYLGGTPYSEENKNNPIYKYFTGTNSLDEICCSTGQSAAQIEEIVERDPNVVMLKHFQSDALLPLRILQVLCCSSFLHIFVPSLLATSSCAFRLQFESLILPRTFSVVLRCVVFLFH